MCSLIERVLGYNHIFYEKKIKWDENKPVYNNERRKNFLRMMTNM